MNAYEELAGYRFGSGRDYDKRSVETYRARVLNLVDELLNQLTQLQDEVADLRDRTRIAPAESLAAPPAVAPVVPTTWLEALAATGELPAEPDDDHAAAAAVTPPAFPAPAVASWLAALDGTHDGDDEGIFGSTAGSTAELLLAAAGNAVAVQAAAVAGGPDAPTAVEPVPVASAAVVTKPLPVVAPPPVAAPMRAPSPARAPIPAPTPAAPPAPPPPAVDDSPLVVTPGDEVVTALVGAIERLPIVLDDGLPDDPPLPTPMRHWGGWMR